MKTIQEKVAYFISSDDEFRGGYDYKIRLTYMDASQEAKKVIDDIFISLCGYSLNTMINKMYHFSELSEEAKMKAMQDYQEGWNETHPDEKFALAQLESFCTDIEDEVFYDINGNIQEL